MLFVSTIWIHLIATWFLQWHAFRTTCEVDQLFQKGRVRGTSGQECIQRLSGVWKPSIAGHLDSQKGVPTPAPAPAPHQKLHFGRCTFLAWLQENISIPWLWSRKGEWSMQWSPAKDNSSFELQSNPPQEQHSRWVEQNILYCSFEMAPTQFPQSHASNSFSILTFPHYWVSRENLQPFNILGSHFQRFQRYSCEVHSSSSWKTKTHFFFKKHIALQW